VRYDEVIRRYLSVREASSREWSLSPALVMTVEVDMSADTYVTMAVGASSSQRRRGPQLLRVTVFRAFYNGPDGDSFHGIDISQVSRPDLMFKADEVAAIEQWKAVIDRWARGAIDDLPPSTSRVLMDRLSRRE
jgi:hypothetical protein